MRGGEAAVGRVAVVASPPAAAATAMGLRSSRIGGGGGGCCVLGCRSSNNEPVHIFSNLLQYNEFDTVASMLADLIPTITVII